MMSQQCLECGKNLALKQGQYGAFYGCVGFPACRYTKSLQDYEAEESHNNILQMKLKALDRLQAKRNSGVPWVNASGLGEVSFCPQAFYLRVHGAQQSDRAVERMQQGNVEHAKVSRDQHCYIATYVFGTNHPITNSLRQWRDEVLMRSHHGVV